MRDAAGAGAVGLTHKHQGDALPVGDLPPQSGVHKDGVGLAVAGVDDQNGQLLALEAVGHIHDVLPGIPQAVAAVVAEGDDAHLDGAVAVNGHIRLGQDLGAVAEGLLDLALLGDLLRLHPGGGVVQAIGQGVGVGEGVVIAGVDGQEGVDLGGGGLLAGHLHLGDAVLGVLRQLGIGKIGGDGVRALGLIVHALAVGGGHAVVGGLPVVHAGLVGGAGEPGGHGHVSLGDLLHIARLQGSQELLVGVEALAVAAGVLAGVQHAAGLGQGGLTGGSPVHEGLADDEDGVLGGPDLQGGGTLAIAHQVELAEGGEHIDAGGVVAAAHKGHGGVHVGLLGGRVGPAVRAGLQHVQALALLIHQVDPALVLQELLGVHPVGDGHHGEVGADGGLGRDVHGDGAAVVHLAVAVHVDVLGEPAGQRQLGRLGPVLLQGGHGVQVHPAQLVQPHGQTGGVSPGHSGLGGQSAVHRLHDPGGQSPGHGVVSPAVQLVGVGIAGQVGGGGDLLPLIGLGKAGGHHSQLLTADGAGDAEAAVGIAGGNALVHRPGGRLREPVARLHVGEGVPAVHGGLPGHLVQHSGPHGPVDLAGGVKLGVADAGHQAVLVGLHHVLVIGGVQSHVGELLGRLIGGGAGDDHGRGHGGGGDDGCQLFAHLVHTILSSSVFWFGTGSARGHHLRSCGLLVAFDNFPKRNC